MVRSSWFSSRQIVASSSKPGHALAATHQAANLRSPEHSASFGWQAKRVHFRIIAKVVHRLVRRSSKREGARAQREGGPLCGFPQASRIARCEQKVSQAMDAALPNLCPPRRPLDVMLHDVRRRR
jgi:hypothetical protein